MTLTHFTFWESLECGSPLPRKGAGSKVWSRRDSWCTWNTQISDRCIVNMQQILMFHFIIVDTDSVIYSNSEKSAVFSKSSESDVSLFSFVVTKVERQCWWKSQILACVILLQQKLKDRVGMVAWQYHPLIRRCKSWLLHLKSSFLWLMWWHSCYFMYFHVWGNLKMHVAHLLGRELIDIVSCQK